MNMRKKLSHQVDLGPALDVKYKELGGTGLVTTPLNMAPNLSECNVSHAGIALRVVGSVASSSELLLGPVFETKQPTSKSGNGVGRG